MATMFSQVVTVGGVVVNPVALNITESEVNPITMITFDFYYDANDPTQIAAIQQGAAASVVINADGRSETYFGSIATLADVKGGIMRIRRVTILGQAEELNRRRFSYIVKARTASAAVAELMSLDTGSSISASGVQVNEDDVGDIILREETVMDGIQRISQLVEWTWRVDDGVLYFEDPDTRPAPFGISSLDNLIASTLNISEDLSTVTNLVRGEVYEYKTVTEEASLTSCDQQMYGAKHSQEWEFFGESRIVTPIDPPGIFNGITIDVDPLNGIMSFSKPIGSNQTSEQEENYFVIVEYKIRRMMLAERKDDTSIALYGERHGQLVPTDGAKDISSGIKLLDLQLARRAFPLLVASCSVDEFGLRPGQIVQLTTIEPNSILNLRVVSVSSRVSGVNLDISVQLSSNAYLGANPVPEFARRIENLEKQGQNPKSYAGFIREENGNITASDVLPDIVTTSDLFTFALAAEGLINGGGDLISLASILQTRQSIIDGGGELLATIQLILERSSTIDGGGVILTEPYKFTGNLVTEDIIVMV